MIDKLMKRRSIRKYTEEAIPEESLRTILKAALLSPTSKNLHPWEFLVIKNKDDLGRLSDCRDRGASMLKEAAVAVIVMADTLINDVWIEDCSIAMSNMLLTAADEGVGGCWIQVRNRVSKEEEKSTEQFVKEMFDLEERYAVEAILSLGMPAQTRPLMELDEKLWNKVHYDKF